MKLIKTLPHPNPLPAGEGVFSLLPFVKYAGEGPGMREGFKQRPPFQNGFKAHP
jgi:hypothetical protein